MCLVLGLGGFVASEAAAETHAVVVGMNDYVNLPRLQGAVADARDISAALKKAGVTDVVTLVDNEEPQPTRKNVLDAIDQLIAHAKGGDLAIITFAGHGGKELWSKLHPPGTKVGEEHEVFLLRNVLLPSADGKIDRARPGSPVERIWGTEIAVRLKRLDEMGVRTIFVADTCHGGGLARDPQSDSDFAFRSFPVKFWFVDGADPLASAAGSLPAPADIDTSTKSLSFLAAVDKESKAPEVVIPKGSGNRRGALSYAFARVIEGKALHEGKTVLSHSDLTTYVQASIKVSVIDNGTGQRPDLRPKDNWDRVVIRFGSDLKQGEPPVVARPAAVALVATVVRIFSADGKRIDSISRPELGYAIEPASSAAAADLRYDPAKRVVSSAGGDLIATDVSPPDLEGVAEREVAIRRLAELARTRERPLTLDRGGDRLYHEGDFMSLDARKPTSEGDGASEYYLLVIISGNGLVQFMYPKNGDPRVLPAFSTLGSMQAGKPFGADYAVLVVDQKPLDRLINTVKALDGTKAPNAVARLIEQSLTPTMRIGFQGVYTASRP